jgi:hypothetical protein
LAPAAGRTVKTALDKNIAMTNVAKSLTPTSMIAGSRDVLFAAAKGLSLGGPDSQCA